MLQPVLVKYMWVREMLSCTNKPNVKIKVFDESSSRFSSAGSAQKYFGLSYLLNQAVDITLLDVIHLSEFL